jgi:calcineurin-like phosphoesterase
VINVLGSLFLHPATSMFEVIDELVDAVRQETPVVLVGRPRRGDQREGGARALARRARDRGRRNAHHVQTSDATVLPKGTAFITDRRHDGAARLGDRRGGGARDSAHADGLPVRFETAQGGVRIEGALVECDSGTGKASSIEAIRVSVS